jgi:hypothetical protein
MSKVAIIRCESYEYNEVKKAVQKGKDFLVMNELRKPVDVSNL